MCGLVGYFSKKDDYSLDRALEKVRSRGPDAQHVYCGGQVKLGHTRLSVIDLKSGSQPMTTNDGRAIIVFNGEIYNFRTLRENLRDLGETFSTSSDTEVLLKGYLMWGEQVVQKLDGIFAFVVYDKRKRKIFIARDRCGIKPLFYQQKSGYFAFGSTLDAVTQICGDCYRINYVALQDYLAFETVSAPDTILKEIKQLEPGQSITYDLTSEQLDIKTYWTPSSENYRGSFDSALEDLDSLLDQTVKAQMVADVPIGAFLSGGIDSSLMTHYMAKHTTGQLKTFSVAFSQKAFDESAYAREVAEKYDTEHFVIEGPQMSSSLLERAASSLDQPLADPAYPLTWFLSDKTKQSVTVAISGDGGDELFGGYDKFNRLAGIKPPTRLKTILGELYHRSLFPGSLLGHFLTEGDWTFYKKVSCGQFRGNRKDFSQFLVNPVTNNVENQPLRKWRELVEEYGGHNSRSALMKADVWTYLSDNCLVKTDRASMASGLEVRVPLLGNAILDFALKMPENIHFSGKSGKQLLKTLASRHLPESVWNREKHGFSVPLNAFFRGQWNEFCEELFQNSGKYFPPINTRTAMTFWRRSCAGKGADRTTYALIILLLWAKKNASILRF